MTTRSPRRGGFTLIELLTVIAIIGVLATLATTAYFRVRASRTTAATEDLMNKLHSVLDQQWTAVLDDARKDAQLRKIPTEILELSKPNDGMGVSNGPADPDRAASLWALAKVKNQFPQSFQEARNGVTLNGFTIPARATFAQVPNTAPANYDEAMRQSAVLLYLALTEQGARGMAANVAETVGAQTMQLTVNGATFTAFKDAWDSPVGFVRWEHRQEVNVKPVAARDYANGSSIDPFDPRARLLTGSWPAAVANSHRTTAKTALNNNLPTVTLGETYAGVTSTNVFQVEFDGRNVIPTLVSAGANREFDDNPTSSATSATPENPLNSDNVYSYRLRRQGQRGD